MNPPPPAPDVVHALWTAVAYLIGGLIGIQFVFSYLVLPIQSWFTSKFQASPMLRPMTVEKCKAPAATFEFHEYVKQQMKTCGFEHVAQVVYPAPPIWGAISLYANSDWSDAGIAVSYFQVTENKAEARNFHYYQFISEYPEGDIKQIETTNTSRPILFPAPPDYFVSRIPHLKTIEKLYECHRSIVQLLSPDRPSVLSLKSGDYTSALRYIIAKTGVEDYEQGFREGYLRKTNGGRIYRPTLIGAFHIGWRIAFPVRQFIEARIRREGMRIEEGARAGTEEFPT